MQPSPSLQGVALVMRRLHLEVVWSSLPYCFHQCVSKVESSGFIDLQLLWVRLSLPLDLCTALFLYLSSNVTETARRHLSRKHHNGLYLEAISCPPSHSLRVMDQLLCLLGYLPALPTSPREILWSKAHSSVEVLRDVLRRCLQSSIHVPDTDFTQKLWVRS
jgi:hypothetical protein